MNPNTMPEKVFSFRIRRMDGVLNVDQEIVLDTMHPILIQASNGKVWSVGIPRKDMVKVMSFEKDAIVQFHKGLMMGLRLEEFDDFITVPP